MHVRPGEHYICIRASIQQELYHIQYTHPDMLWSPFNVYNVKHTDNRKH